MIGPFECLPEPRKIYYASCYLRRNSCIDNATLTTTWPLAFSTSFPNYSVRCSKFSGRWGVMNVWVHVERDGGDCLVFEREPTYSWFVIAKQATVDDLNIRDSAGSFEVECGARDATTHDAKPTISRNNPWAIFEAIWHHIRAWTASVERGAAGVSRISSRMRHLDPVSARFGLFTAIRP